MTNIVTDFRGAGLAVIAVRGGLWRWPAGTGFSFSELGVSLPTITLDVNGSFLGVRLPIYSPASDPQGGRRMYLLAGYNTAVEGGAIPDLLQTHGMHPLDKLLNEYVLWWPGVVQLNQTSHFLNFLDDDATNPTHALRQIARELNKDILQGKLPMPSLSALVTVNQMFDPDWYGFYYGYISPENNNFATDFIRPAILTAVGLVADNFSTIHPADSFGDKPVQSAPFYGHPCKDAFISLVQQAVQMDFSHSITMPSGATQEAPGYLVHAMEAWVDDASIYHKFFGMNILTNPRLLASVDFLFQMAHPFNYHMLGVRAADPSRWGGRYITPIGDTHPSSVNYSKLQDMFAFKPTAPSKLKSVELEGFGVVFRSQPGTSEETFLSFKAGPNQGHDHGDQLSIHWCAYGVRHSIDLMFGYNPRPLQEFWHNRMSFGVGGTQQNMDGFARLIAVKFDKFVDVAVGTVSSRRLRTPPAVPPGIWGAHYQETALNGPLNYTRTVLLVKKGSQRDYAVLRDSFNSPIAVDAVLNQWYMQDGPTPCASVMSHTPHQAIIDLCNSTLFVAALNGGDKLVNFSSYRWTNHSEGNEFATGVRISVDSVSTTDIVSILYPSGSLTTNIAPIPSFSINGPTVTLKFTKSGAADMLTFDSSGNLVTFDRKGAVSMVVLQDSDLDLGRRQGKVGLTTLDAGYDFGYIPDWLVNQRLANSVYYWPINSFFASRYHAGH